MMAGRFSGLKNAFSRGAEKLEGCLPPVYGCMIGGVLAVCMLCSGIRFGRSELCGQYLPAAVLLAFGTVFLSGLFACCGRVRWECRSLRPVALLLFLVQAYCVYQYYFYTDWDIKNLVRISDAIVHGGDVSSVPGIGYFSVYSNNLLLAYVVTAIRKAAHFAGFHAYEYYVILCVQCALNAVTGLLLVQVLGELFGDQRLSLFGYDIYLLLVGASPWVSIPYSDSMGLIFPVLIVYLYITRKKARNAFLPWFGIAAASVIGYQLKPQVFIVFIAIVLLELLRVCKEGPSKGFLMALAGIAAGAICASIAAQAAVDSLHVPLDENREFQLPHYFMMGMNPDDMGVWSEEDVGFSSSFRTVEERNRADIERAVERIKAMGAVGLCKHIIRKNLSNYYDGTFCWGGEGEFFAGVLEAKDNPLCAFLRGLYYTRGYSDVGKYYAVWSNFQQMVWLTVLLWGIFAGFGKKPAGQNVIMLAIIGLTIFESIFEARARYLYTYAPLYIVLAVSGFRAVSRGGDGFPFKDAGSACNHSN